LINLLNQSLMNRFILFKIFVIGNLIGIAVFSMIHIDLQRDLYLSSWIQANQKTMISSLSLVINWLNAYSFYLYISIVASSIWLGYFLFLPSIYRQRKIVDYRRKEEHLIKP
ncbi:MAG: hypothetical protein ACKO7R_05395, partial [Pseudanabaena sp.]